jgi:ornithine decarboxylase
MSLRDGDLVDILSAGAYTTAYAAPGFNGFPAPSEHYI